MGIVKRGSKLWITYSLPRELAAEHGCKRLVRESAKTGDKREAAKLLAQRKREIRDGTWRPSSLGGHALTVASYAERWSAERKKMGLRSAARDAERLRHLLERLGPMRLSDVRRQHVRHAVTEMLGRTSAHGKPFAPGSVHVSYNALRAMFSAAVRDDLIQVNPCSLRSTAGEIPSKTDADPRWRSQAIFTRTEIVQLLSDELVPEYRRVLYALLFFGGLRLGEAAARTWADYDTEARPLGRLLVATQHEGRELKTERPREVPVHPALAGILERWRLGPYAVAYGDHPRPGDLIVRGASGQRVTVNATWLSLQADLKRLGLRKRRVHDLRRTMISLARADGARGDILRWVTHGPTRDIVDVYTTPEWAVLCEQVACLRVGLKE